MTAQELESLLKPLEPTKWTGLRKGTDGRYYYLAELESEPSGDFIERQHQAYQSRGVFTRAIGESPHSVPRTLGYEHLLFRKGRSRPWSLYSLVIDDSNSEWISKAPFYRQYPKPSHLEGRLFVFRLGQSDVTAWNELVIVPEQDVMTLKELPFARFPGATINWVYGEKGQYQSVTRRYVVRGRRIAEVLDHYRDAVRQIGIPIDYDRTKTATLLWSSHDSPVNGIKGITVEPAPPSLIFGKPLGLERVRELAPSLFEGFPDPLAGFQVTVDFADAALAAPYQPDEDSYQS